MDLNLFNTILILLVVSITITALFQRLKLPLLIGYILVGILLGPFATAIISESTTLKMLAEFGIVFLMFIIGLEFSVTQLINLKKDVFGFGGLQVILSFMITVFIGHLLAIPLIESIIVGAIVAMSSTAIVFRQLTDRLEINSPDNQHAIGILLFQDLAVIPILMFLPTLADPNLHSMVNQLGISVIKSALAILIILSLGKWVLRPIFYNIANAYSLELFTLTTLFITLSFAWITSYFGLSMALGAFLAGITLGETEFRHQIKKDIRPFVDVLVGFFFITIGMQFNLQIISFAWNWMLLMLLALIFFKILLISLLGLYFIKTKGVALQTGLMLAQGGEFGFAILINATSHQLIPHNDAEVIIGALLLSMAISPLLIKYRQKIADLVTQSFFPISEKEKPAFEILPVELENHVILCGYGRVGQNIARFLEKAELKYLALDLDPIRVKNAQLAGDNIFYADASDYEVLRSAQISKARAVIVSFINPHAAIGVLEQVRKHHKSLPIIVRSHDENETSVFYEKGATEVIPELLEASLMIASHILLLMNIAPRLVDKWINESRHNRYALLRMVFPGQEALFTEETEAFAEELTVVSLMKDAFAINKKIMDLRLDEIKVKITTVRRGNERFMNPALHFILQENDIVVLYGVPPYLEKAEKRLLIGEGLA